MYDDPAINSVTALPANRAELINPADPPETDAPASRFMTRLRKKFLRTGGSMALSAYLYALLFGWPTALGLVGLLFVHEMGHWAAMRQKKVEAEAPLFIPFVGAFIRMPHNPDNAGTMAYIALAGPVIGSLAALACQLLGIYLHSKLFLQLALVGYVLNLFNMIPYGPLDGGRVIEAVSPKLWGIGFILLTLWGLLTHNYVVFAIIFLGIFHLIDAFQKKKEKDPYYSLPWQIRLKWAGIYVVVFVSLIFAIASL